MPLLQGLQAGRPSEPLLRLGELARWAHGGAPQLCSVRELAPQPQRGQQMAPLGEAWAV